MAYFWYILIPSLLIACQREPVESKIAIVNIRKLDRAQIADLLNVINKHKPAVVGIDATFRNDTEVSKDNKLIEALIRTNNLVMPSVIRNFDGIQKKYESFYMATSPEYLLGARTGFVNAIIEEYNDMPHISKFSSVEYVKGIPEYHFAVAVAMSYDSSKTFSYLATKTRLINVDYRVTDFKVFDYADVLKNCTDQMIKDKIILFGDLGQTDYDIYYNPLSSSNQKTPSMYGVVHLAHVITQLLK